MREPILSVSEYERQHEVAAQKLLSYAASRFGADKLTAMDLRPLKRSNAGNLPAINMYARVAFAKATALRLQELQRRRNLKEVHFVDLVSNEYIGPVRSASKVDITALKRWTSQQLPGMNYFGGVDAAYYVNGSYVGVSNGPALGWHSHVVVWNISERELEKLARRTNSAFKAPNNFRSSTFPATKDMLLSFLGVPPTSTVLSLISLETRLGLLK